MPLRAAYHNIRIDEMITKFLKFIRNVTLGVGVLLCALWFYLSQPSFSSSARIDLPVDEKRMEAVVRKLSVDFHPRNFRRTDNLEKAVAYIAAHFQEVGGNVEIQEFEVSDSIYKNVRCFFGDRTKPRLIIGARYDSNDQTPGADDNASGVAGLIELAYLLADTELPNCIELVAYPLEEPPFFATNKMGSYVHAESLEKEEVEVIGMLALEMIGYYSDEFGLQTYPSPLFHVIYLNTGNFIAVIGKMDQRDFTNQVKLAMKGTSDLRVFSVNAPEKIPGIDFSDHRNYWAYDYNAVMITDTAFYRNTAYHTAEDTWDTLNYAKMADVVRGVYNFVIEE